MGNTRIVFFGSSTIGASLLRILLDKAATYGYSIVGVVTKKDAYAGRNMKMTQNEVKQLAQEKGIPVIDTKDDILSFLKEKEPNLAIVYSYGSLLKHDVLSFFTEEGRHGMLNIHTSFLPYLRGAVPVQTAIFSGLTETGVSIIQVGDKMDAGDILVQEKVPIELTDTLGTLTEKLYTLGANLLLERLNPYLKGMATLVPQDEEGATFCYIKDLEKIYGVTWQSSAQTIERAIRAIAPYAYISLPVGQTPMQLIEARVVPEDEVISHIEGVKGIGDIVSWKEDGKRRILVRTGKDYLEIVRTKPQGKNTMQAADLWNGYIQKAQS